MIRAMLMGMGVHNGELLKCEAAKESVAMPLASLSTLAVIMPDPAIDRSMTIFLQHFMASPVRTQCESGNAECVIISDDVHFVL